MEHVQFQCQIGLRSGTNHVNRSLTNGYRLQPLYLTQKNYENRTNKGLSMGILNWHGSVA